uniref:F-box domain-containing protein n=1 Tax=Panagrolaimus davidi TaxID=227884 RepID=A0A914PLT4_9BILA
MSGNEENGGGVVATDSTLSTTSTVSTVLSVASVSTAISTDILLQLDSFPDDVLFAVFKRLDIQNRLNCAKVNHRWNKLLKKWVDIQSFAISEKHFSVKNECIESSVTFKVLDTTRINPMVFTFLKKCTHIFHLVIHNAQILKYFATIWSKFENLKLLAIPNDTFDELKFKDSATLLHLLSNPQLQSLHILEHVKSFPSKKRVFAPLHVSYMNQSLRVFHAHGIIFGPLAMEKMAEKYRESLQELRIGAVCVNTPDAERYFKALSKLKNLKVLELPPSLFSISHPLDTQYLPVLTEMKKLECLSVFICPSGGSDASSFLQYLPKSVRKLIVRSYTDELPENVVANLVQRKVELIFHPKKSYSFRWPFKRCDVNYQLFIKGFWEPPYFAETELIGVNLTPEVIRAQSSNWACNLPELSKFEIESVNYEAVETAQHRPTDLVTASSPPTIRNARERSPIVGHPSTDNVVQEVMNRMLDQVGVASNEANGRAQSPLIRPASPPANVTETNLVPLPAAQQLQPPQDGISSNALSTPTTTAIFDSSKNVTTTIEELVLDATQRSDESLLQSVASVPYVSTTSEQTSSTSAGSTETSSSSGSTESTTSGSGSSTTTSSASTSSVGTGWYV